MEFVLLGYVFTVKAVENIAMAYLNHDYTIFNFTIHVFNVILHVSNVIIFNVSYVIIFHEFHVIGLSLKFV